MEVKITISDSDAAAKTSIAVSGMGTPDQTYAPFGSQPSASSVTPPPDVLRAAAAIGAMNAGPAPTFGNAAVPDGPPAFITGATDQAAVNSRTGGMTTGPSHSAGAAPGSGMQAEMFTAADIGGEDGV